MLYDDNGNVIADLGTTDAVTNKTKYKGLVVFVASGLSQEQADALILALVNAACDKHAQFDVPLWLQTWGEAREKAKETR